VKVLNFHGVSYCDYLNIRMLEQVADIGLALPPAADNCQVDLFAGRDEFRSTQHVARHEGKPGDRSGRADEEFAPGERLFIYL